MQNNLLYFLNKSFANLRSVKMNSSSFSFLKGKLYLIVWKLPLKQPIVFNLNAVEGGMGLPRPGQSRAVGTAQSSFRVPALADR